MPTEKKMKPLHEDLVATTVTPEDLAAIDLTKRIAEVEAQIEEVPKSRKQKILQEIKIDQFNTVRRWVDLTPSMCTHRACGFDSAKEVGYPAGWEAVPQDQRLPGGKTVGETVLDILAKHIASSHGAETAHILDEETLRDRGQWAGVQGKFLTSAQ